MILKVLILKNPHYIFYGGDCAGLMIESPIHMFWTQSSYVLDPGANLYFSTTLKRNACFL